MNKSEELEAIKLSDEMLVEYKSNEVKREQNDEIIKMNKQKRNLRQLKLRRLKKYLIMGVSLATLIGASAGAIKLYQRGYSDGKENAIASIKKDQLRTYNIKTAPEKLQIEWANAIMDEFSNDVLSSKFNEPNEIIENIKRSSFAPAMQDYYEYKENGDIEKYNSFVEKLCNLEKSLNSINTGKDYSFNNTVFARAILLDAENNITEDNNDENVRIFVAEDYFNEDYGSMNLKEGSVVKNGIIYSPYDSNELVMKY